MRTIGLAEFNRYADRGRIHWIASSPIVTPGHVALLVGNDKSSWTVRVRDTKQNRVRLSEAWRRANVAFDYGTDRFGNR
jgi:hypothetical protein